MVNQAEFDLRVSTHYANVTRRNLPTGEQATTQRALLPGTLATKFLALAARFTPHGRNSTVAVGGTAHS